jgi:hypothetical protein
LTGTIAESWCCWPVPAKPGPGSRFLQVLSLRLSAIRNGRHVWPGSFDSRQPTSSLLTGLMPPASDDYWLRVARPMLWMHTL